MDLKLVEVKPLYDNRNGGTSLGRVRIAFDTLQGFDHFKLSKIKTIRLPSMATITVRMSTDGALFVIWQGAMLTL